MAAEGGHPQPVQRLLVASMGPRPDGRGRVHAGQGRRPSIARQWGRGRMAAEGHVPLDGERGGIASMGPRPDGRGRSSRFSMSLSAYKASMGPRPDGRGRGRPLSGCLSPGRVNGAAAGWPRKVDIMADQFLAYSSVNGAAAGWPRKVVQGRDGAGDELASMGPRPDGRGRPPRRALGAFTQAWRQWGRGRMAAEGGLGDEWRARTRSVNGAAAGWPRKVGLHGQR